VQINSRIFVAHCGDVAQYLPEQRAKNVFENQTVSGWIRIDRAVFEHPLFKPEPMTEREAWMWMLCKAAYEDTQHRVGGVMMDVPRGSFMVTLRELQSVFMWRSDKRVRSFLNRLESGRMVGRAKVGPTNAPKTHVTICNYELFQGSGRTEDAPGTHEGRTDGRSKVTKITNNNKQDSLFVAESPKPKPKSKPAATMHLPADWIPNDSDTDYALSQQLHTDDIKEMADEFQTYWAERTDAKARKSQRGWSQCWRGHVRRGAATFIRNRRMAGQTGSGGYGQGGGIAGAVARRRAAN